VKRLAALAIATLWPAVASACAVCGTATERNRTAFFIMTIVMSLLPLGLIGAGVLWFRRKLRQAEPREHTPAPKSASTRAVGALEPEH